MPRILSVQKTERSTIRRTSSGEIGSMMSVA